MATTGHINKSLQSIFVKQFFYKPSDSIPLYSAAQTQLDMRVRATRVTRNITCEYHLRACASTREWCTAHTRVETRECAEGEPRACAREYSQTNSRVLANELASTSKRTREYSQTNTRVLAKDNATNCNRTHNDVATSVAIFVGA